MNKRFILLILASLLAATLQQSCSPSFANDQLQTGINHLIKAHTPFLYHPMHRECNVTPLHYPLQLQILKSFMVAILLI